MDLTQYLDPTVAAVAVVLYIVGYALKRSETIKDKYIPFLLMLIGIILCIAWYTVLAPSWGAILNGVIQGILSAGVAVITNQLYKQSQKED